MIMDSIIKKIRGEELRGWSPKVFKIHALAFFLRRMSKWKDIIDEIKQKLWEISIMRFVSGSASSPLCQWIDHSGASSLHNQGSC